MKSIALGVIGVCGLAFLAGRASTLLCPGSCALGTADANAPASRLVSAGLAQPGTDASQPEMPPEFEAMMAANQPGEHHEILAKMVGSWTTVMEATMEDGTEMNSTGTMQVEPIFEGRFVGQHFQGDFMGIPFEGMGVYGYSTMTNEYQYAWFDSMGTHLYTAAGQMNGDILEFKGQEPSPEGDGEMVDYRDEFEWNGNDEYSMTRFYTHDGEEMQGFKITFTRQ